MSLSGGLLAGGLLGAAGGVASSAIGASAAGNAASTQAQASEESAQLQAQAEQNALQFQEGVYGQQQANAAPWLQSGAGAMSTLDRLMGLNAPNIPSNYGQPMPLSAMGTNGVPQGSQQFTGGIPGLTPGQGSGGYSPLQLNGGSPVTTRNPPSSDMGPVGNGALQLNGGSPVATQGGRPIMGQPGYNAVNKLPINNGTAPGNTAGIPARPNVPTLQSGLGGPSTPAPGIASGQLSPFTSWNQQFQAPTAATEQNDPGYQFRLQQGEQALQNSAAANGTLLTGNTAKDINAYGQDYASNEYGNVYNRALGQYQQNYNIFQQNQANQFNRLASLAGMGQTAVGQLNSAGSSAGNQVGSTLLGSSQGIGNALQNAGAATASGYVGGANAITGGISSGIGNLQQMMLLNQLGGGSGGGGADWSQIDTSGLGGAATG